MFSASGINQYLANLGEIVVFKTLGRWELLSIVGGKSYYRAISKPFKAWSRIKEDMSWLRPAVI